jgi:hypothetical protein
MGAGACGVSAKLTGRNFVGVEKSEKYYNIAKMRIDNVKSNVVTPADHQLTTQIHKDMKTTPAKKYESEILQKLRDAVDNNQDISSINLEDNNPLDPALFSVK